MLSRVCDDRTAKSQDAIYAIFVSVGEYCIEVRLLVYIHYINIESTAGCRLSCFRKPISSVATVECEQHAYFVQIRSCLLQLREAHGCQLFKLRKRTGDISTGIVA